MRARTLHQMGERELLRAIAGRLGRDRSGVVIGVGDDAAVLRAVGPNAVLTTDLLVEGVDFERRWARASDVGHKAAAVNLSDLAAMGARPRALLLALALRSDDAVADVLALVSAVDRVGRRWGAPLVGGDLSRTNGPLVAAVTAVGQLESGRALRRARGRAGDVVLVSGRLGGAAAGIGLLTAGKPVPGRLAARQLRPTPRVTLGRLLGRSGLVRSCADVSDGLATDALHLAGPGCGVDLDVAAVPIDRGVVAAAAAVGKTPLDLALAGGEDFELVVAVAPRHVAAVQRLGRRVGVPLTVVGHVRRQRGLSLAGVPAQQLAGFDHFGPGADDSPAPSRRAGRGRSEFDLTGTFRSEFVRA